MACQGGFHDRVVQIEASMKEYRCFSAPEVEPKNSKDSGKNEYECESATDKCHYKTTSPVD